MSFCSDLGSLVIDQRPLGLEVRPGNGVCLVEGAREDLGRAEVARVKSLAKQTTPGFHQDAISLGSRLGDRGHLLRDHERVIVIRRSM